MEEFSPKNRIDLNCDLGEGCGSDAALMPLISSASIACGGHAGDAGTMRRTAELALEHGVSIGAHPGYDDRENFGRIPQQLSGAELRSLLLTQLDALREVVERLGGRIAHVKPHGALYNQSAFEPEIAAAIADCVKEWDSNAVLVGLSGSCSINAAELCGLRTASEAFADRRYDVNGGLAPRGTTGALITEASTAATQVLDIVRYGRARSTAGTMIRVAADTVCIHGDGPTAVETAKRIMASLLDAGIAVARIDG